jgi:hypothetical protein
MQLTKRCLLFVLLIIPTFSIIQEKRVSGQLISQNDNHSISGVIVTIYGLKKSRLELSYDELPGNGPSLKPLRNTGFEIL